MKQNKDNKTKLVLVTIGVVVGIFSFILFPLSLFNCNKTPTTSKQSKQVTVTGSITENTVWETGKEYVVEGVVTVEQGVSLNISGKVTVLFKADEQGNKGKLRVNGSLQAVGTDSTSAVLFKPYDASQQEDAYGIELDQSEGCGVFEFCRFEGLTYGVNAYEASVLVNECTFFKCVNGVTISKCDSALIQDSEFVDNDYGVRTDLAPVEEDSVRVIGNVFLGISECGVEVNNYSKAVVRGNLFTDCETGLKISNYSVCRVVYNDFKECNICCYCYRVAKSMIQMNTFNSSSIALKIHISDVRIAKNNILSLEKWKLEFLHKDSSVQLNAENNWWNSLKEDEINFFIWDGNNVSDDQWEGVVDFVPFESAVLINGVMKLSKIVSNNEKN